MTVSVKKKKKKKKKCNFFFRILYKMSLVVYIDLIFNVTVAGMIAISIETLKMYSQTYETIKKVSERMKLDVDEDTTLDMYAIFFRLMCVFLIVLIRNLVV